VNLDGVLLIDSHIHIYPTREEGATLKATYEIPDYGDKDDVVYSERGGDLDDASEAMDEAGVASAAVLNIYEIPGSPTPPGGRWWPASPPHADRRDDLVASNEWLCGLTHSDRRLMPFISVHPGVMTAPDSTAHVEDLFERAGARGVKLHPNAQRIDPADPQIDGVYALCEERGAPIIAHSGIDVQGQGLADLESFVPVLERYPRLKLVLAHLGGGRWEHAEEFAARYPHAYFDLCEIIEWTGSEIGPTRKQLGALIKRVGPERVLMGSDFPWYDLDRTVELVMDLPSLSHEEKIGIVGRNAAQLLELEVTRA
jgi:predicted TIM-barrel fold metal-dependent hydrolase